MIQFRCYLYPVMAIIAYFNAYVVSAQFTSYTVEEYCWTPCLETPESNVPVPGTDCKTFYVCRSGRVTNSLACSDGRAFDVSIGACNHAGLVNCIDPSCPPSAFPTSSPSHSPTKNPSTSPTGTFCSVCCVDYIRAIFYHFT